MDKQKPQTIHHQANRNPKQFTIRQIETPANSLSGSSPPDQQKPHTIHHRAAHHCTNRNSRRFTIRQFTTRQKPLGCSPPDRNLRQFTIGQFTTGQTETLGLFTTRQKPQTIHRWDVHHWTDRNPRQFTICGAGMCYCVIFSAMSPTHTDTYSQDGRLLKVDADGDLLIVTGGKLSQVIILSVVNCLAVNCLCCTSASSLTAPLMQRNRCLQCNKIFF